MSIRSSSRNSKPETWSSWTTSDRTRAQASVVQFKPLALGFCIFLLQSDFNPIENAFAKLKALLRKAAERTIEGLWTRIGELLPAFTPNECKNYFAAAGYHAR
jgi:hypothetical protein